MGWADTFQKIGNVLTATGTGLQGGNVTAVLAAQKQQYEQNELQKLLDENYFEIKTNPKKYYELMRDFYVSQGNLPASMQATAGLQQLKQAQKGKALEDAGMAINTKEKSMDLYTPGSSMQKAAGKAHDSEIKTLLAKGGATAQLFKMAKDAEKNKLQQVDLANKQYEAEQLQLHQQSFTDALYQGDMNAARKHAVEAGLKPNQVRQLFATGTPEQKNFFSALDQVEPGLNRMQKLTRYHQNKFDQTMKGKNAQLQMDIIKKSIPQQTITRDAAPSKLRVKQLEKLDAVENVINQIGRIQDMVKNDSTGVVGFIKGTYQDYRSLVEQMGGVPMTDQEFDSNVVNIKQAFNSLLVDYTRSKQTGRVSNQLLDMFEKEVGKPNWKTSPAKLFAQLDGMLKSELREKKHIEDFMARLEQLESGDTKRIDAFKTTSPSKAELHMELRECMGNGTSKLDCIKIMDKKYR